jgi:NAD(P)-dependent dehydrogenase (short-subunit alcohol dehydrogenase family)
MVRTGIAGLAIAAALSSAPLHAVETDPPPKTVETETRKAVLVTGASSGIGLTITGYLAERGFHVYAGARKDSDLERLDAMENVTSVRLDVTRQTDIDAAVEFVSSQGRGLFGVVNNAGVASVGLLSTVPDDDVLWIHDVNVMGPLRVNRAFLPMLMESAGRTVIIGSLSAYVSSPSGGAYSMSKIALEAYTETLADELAATGVSVGIIDPGPYRSRGREKVAMQMLTGSPDLQQELTDEQKALLAQVKQANDKLKEPDEVAEAVVRFLTSDSPRLRSMVSPDGQTADLSIRAALTRAVQLNADQPYELSRDELVALLDELLETDDGDTK